VPPSHVPLCCLLLLLALPPRSPLFPYTTLFRSQTHSLVDGFRIYRTKKPDVIIIDLATQAGTLGGLSFIRRLRIHDSRTPILVRSEEHTSELQSLTNLVCRLLLEKKKSLYVTYP